MVSLPILYIIHCGLGDNGFVVELFGPCHKMASLAWRTFNELINLYFFFLLLLFPVMWSKKRSRFRGTHSLSLDVSCSQSHSEALHVDSMYFLTMESTLKNSKHGGTKPNPQA